MYTKIVEVPNLSLNGEDTVCVWPPLTLTLNEYTPPSRQKTFIVTQHFVRI